MMNNTFSCISSSLICFFCCSSVSLIYQGLAVIGSSSAYAYAGCGAQVLFRDSALTFTIFILQAIIL